MSTHTKERAGLSWEEICHDPRFRDLPYKIETNARGQIVMSPTHQYHGALQNKIGTQLDLALSNGTVVTDSAIATSDGKKIADVAWYSSQRWERVNDELDASIAPEIAVEVYSPGNTEEEEELAHKRGLYFEAGAEEVWICDENGRITFYDADGEIERSHRVPSFPSQVEI